MSKSTTPTTTCSIIDEIDEIDEKSYINNIPAHVITDEQYVIILEELKKMDEEDERRKVRRDEHRRSIANFDKEQKKKEEEREKEITNANIDICNNVLGRTRNLQAIEEAAKLLRIKSEERARLLAIKETERKKLATKEIIKAVPQNNLPSAQLGRRIVLLAAEQTAQMEELAAAQLNAEKQENYDRIVKSFLKMSETQLEVAISLLANSVKNSNNNS